MVVSSILLYLRVRKRRYLNVIPFMIMLVVADVLFMAMMYYVFEECGLYWPVRNYLLEGSSFFTLCASGLFLIILIIALITVCIKRKKAGKKQSM